MHHVFTSGVIDNMLLDRIIAARAAHGVEFAVAYAAVKKWHGADNSARAK